MSGKILVVDDERAILEISMRVISELGFTVHTASDGQAALNAVIREDGGYEMVLTDMKMPHMDGLQLVAMLKRRFPAVDVVVMTGFPEIEAAVETLKQGAYDYLIKPVDIDVLSACVNRCMEKRQMAAALDSAKRSVEDLRAGLAALEEALRGQSLPAGAEEALCGLKEKVEKLRG